MANNSLPGTVDREAILKWSRDVSRSSLNGFTGVCSTVPVMISSSYKPVACLSASLGLQTCCRSQVASRAQLGRRRWSVCYELQVPEMV